MDPETQDELRKLHQLLQQETHLRQAGNNASQSQLDDLTRLITGLRGDVDHHFRDHGTY